MPRNLPFKIDRSIMCEDVREEKNGKYTLVGVYVGDIQFSAIPGNIAIAFFLEVSLKRSGKFEIHFRLSGPGDHSALIKATVLFGEITGPAVIATPRIDLLVDQEGDFTMEISSDGANWTTIAAKRISLNPSLAISPQPPS